MLKKALLRDENRNQIEPRTGFLSLMSKRRNNADVLPILPQDKNILHKACTLQPLFVLRT